MHVIESNKLDVAYVNLIDDILTNGKEVKPRGMTTKELHPVTLKLTDPTYNLITNKYRAINPLFMLAEFVWMFSGSYDVHFLTKYNKKMAQFSDDGITFHGAYGRRLLDWYGHNQIQLAYDKLKGDKDTRQAVLLIFDPAKDYRKTKDVPCNNYLKFTIRENKLDLTVYIRSQDMILGMPYDIYHWTMFQRLMADFLNLDLGTYYHIMDSAHIYDHDFELSKKIVSTYDGHTYPSKLKTVCETPAEFLSWCKGLKTKISNEEFDDSSYDIDTFATDILLAFKSKLMSVENNNNEYIIMYETFLNRKTTREIL